MSAVVVHHHLGIGDHFICNGLVRTLVDRYERIYLPSKRHYHSAVSCLYAEEDRVTVFPVDDESKDIDAFAARHGCPIIRVGFERCDPWQFDRSFYDQLNIPFENRYTRFKLPQVIPHEDELFDRLSPDGPYCLVHREGTVGIFELRIESALPRVYVEKGADPFNNILAFRKLISGAAEIHCINSSVIHLVDGINPRGALFYHKVRRTDFTLRPCWRVVPYASTPVLGTWRRAVARARLIRARARAERLPS
jgi:hypothetical protein